MYIAVTTCLFVPILNSMIISQSQLSKKTFRQEVEQKLLFHEGRVQ